jgi:hypothetical protein
MAPLSGHSELTGQRYHSCWRRECDWHFSLQLLPAMRVTALFCLLGLSSTQLHEGPRAEYACRNNLQSYLQNAMV